MDNSVKRYRCTKCTKTLFEGLMRDATVIKICPNCKTRNVYIAKNGNYVQFEKR